MNRIKIYKILTLFLIAQVILVTILTKFPQLIEVYYSNGIYPLISKIFRALFGWIPFSIGDVYYFLLGIFLLYSLFTFFKGITLKNISERLWKFGAFISVFYFLFHFLWGMNYHRDSLFKNLDLEEREYTTEELLNLSNDLLNKTKDIHQQIVQIDTNQVSINDSKEYTIDLAKNGYQNLSKGQPSFKYNVPSIKKSLFSLPLTYMGFSGYFNPLSGEAQVDYLVPKISLPMIASHEIAHQLGYASESEANFIGFLAATHNDTSYYKYAGYLYALRYAMAATYGRDSVLGKTLIDSIPVGIKKNIIETQDFWRSYQNKAEPFFKLFYDNYLKINQQKDGIKGYSKMVGLLVAYREKYEL